MVKNLSDDSVIQFLDGDIKRLREAGYTLEQIAEKGGVTRERIRQVINKYYPGVEPKLLSTSQVAKRFKVTESAIRGLRKHGLVHPVRRGNIYRYDEKALEEVKAALNRPCRICGKPIGPAKSKLCNKCSRAMRNPKSRLKLPGERKKHQEAVKRWQEAANYRAELSKRNYEMSVYKVRLAYPGFKIGERFKAIGSQNRNLLLADGRVIPTVVIIKVSGPKSRPTVKRVRARKEP